MPRSSSLAPAALALVVLVGAVAVGSELRAIRGRPSATERAFAAGARPTASPSPAAASSQAATPVPTPRPTKATATATLDATRVVSGRVTAGGKAAAGMDVYVYPASEWNRGPTPMPPHAALVKTGTDGRFSAAVPPGAYRIGAFFPFTSDPVKRALSPFWYSTWYGGGPVIGSGADVRVGDRDLGAVDIAMLRVVTISGRVRMHDGSTVAGAAVHADPNYPGVAYVALGTAQTDASGAYAVRMAAGPIHLAAGLLKGDQPYWTARDLVARADTTLDLVLATTSPKTP